MNEIDCTHDASPEQTGDVVAGDPHADPLAHEPDTIVSAPGEAAPNGVTLVAGYRAARLSQRAALRASLQQSHLARRQSREARLLRPPAASAPPPPVAPVPEPDATEPQSVDAGSVFANLVSLSAAPVEPPPAEPPPAEPVAAETQADDPPLAEIGFGPGMLIRLSQLGLHTTGDLAQADAGQLRAALGDISRLVDVETWISNARQTASGRAEK